MATRRLTDSSEAPAPWLQAQPTPPRRHEGLQVDYTFLRRYRIRQVDHTSFLFGSKQRLADQPFNDDRVENQEYKYYSKLGLPYISIFTVFKVIAAAVALVVMLFGLIKALIKAIKELLKTMKKVIKVAGSLKMPDLSGEFLPDIPGLPKIPKLKLPSVPGLPSPPKLSLGKMFSLSGLSFSPIMAPLAILAAIALLTKYRMFKARLWPPLSGLPGLRNGLYRLPYRSFKGVFSHLPYFDQLYNAGGRFMGIAGLPTVASNPGDQPMSASVPRPKIQGFSGDPYYDLVLSDWQYTHGVILGKSLLIPSIILNLSMRFKQFKEMVPLMGPPSVKEMFGMESFVQKIMRLLAKGAVAAGAAGAASAVFLEIEAVCPWPQDLQGSQLEAVCSWPVIEESQGSSELGRFFRQSFHSDRPLHPEEAQCPLWLFPAVPGEVRKVVSLQTFL